MFQDRRGVFSLVLGSLWALADGLAGCQQAMASSSAIDAMGLISGDEPFKSRPVRGAPWVIRLGVALLCCLGRLAEEMRVPLPWELSKTVCTTRPLSDLFVGRCMSNGDSVRDTKGSFFGCLRCGRGAQ